MPRSIISSKASNWVDRGEAPNRAIERVLGRLLDRHPDSDPTWFRQQAEIVIGMVAAEATEVHIVGFLRSLSADGSPIRDAGTRRLTAIALWHIAKAALVRDTAERVLRADPRATTPTPDSLGHWLATRLLSPDELAAFEARAQESEGDS